MIHEAPPTDLHWAELHVDALALHDDVGRMLRWNAVGGESSLAPILFFAATSHGNLWRVRAGLPDALTRELCRLAAAERTQAAADADPERLPTFEERISAAFPEGSPQPTETFRGSAFCFAEAPAADPGVSLLREEELAELADAFPELAGSVGRRLPCAALRDGGRIVSACYAATLPGTRGGVEAGVETIASHRGRGFAPRVVSSWAAEVARGGRTPLYSAGRGNHASLAVARRLRLRRYATTLHIREAR